MSEIAKKKKKLHNDERFISTLYFGDEDRLPSDFGDEGTVLIICFALESLSLALYSSSARMADAFGG